MKAQILTELFTTFLQRPARGAEKVDGNLDGHFAEMVGAAAEAEVKDADCPEESVSSSGSGLVVLDSARAISALSISKAVMVGAMMPLKEGATEVAAAISADAENVVGPVEASPHATADGDRALTFSGRPDTPPLMSAEVGEQPDVDVDHDARPGSAESALNILIPSIGNGDGGFRTSKKNEEADHATGGMYLAQSEAGGTPLAVPVEMRQAASLITADSDQSDDGGSMKRAIEITVPATEGTKTAGADTGFSGAEEDLRQNDQAGGHAWGGAEMAGIARSSLAKTQDMAALPMPSHNGSGASEDLAAGDLDEIPAGQIIAAPVATREPAVWQNESKGLQQSAPLESPPINQPSRFREGALSVGTSMKLVPVETGAAAPVVNEERALAESLAPGAGFDVPRAVPVNNEQGRSIPTEQEDHAAEVPLKAARSDLGEIRSNLTTDSKQEMPEEAVPLRQGRSDTAQPASGTVVIRGATHKDSGSRNETDLTAAAVVRARAEFIRAAQNFDAPAALRILPPAAPVSEVKLDGLQAVAAEGRAPVHREQGGRTAMPEVRSDSSPVAANSPASDPASDPHFRGTINAEPPAGASAVEYGSLVRGVASPAVAINGKEPSGAGEVGDVPEISDTSEISEVSPSRGVSRREAERSLPEPELVSSTPQRRREGAASKPSSGRETATNSATQPPSQEPRQDRDVSASPAGLPVSLNLSMTGGASIAAGSLGMEGTMPTHATAANHSVHLLQGERQMATFASGASHQIAQAVSSSGDRPVELTLSPEELGKVRLTLHSHDATITVTVQAERSDTLDLLRRNIDLLARDFREIGYGDVSFSFGEQASGGRNPDQSAAAAALPEREADAPPRFQTTPVSVLSAGSDLSGGLDLRM